MRQATTAKVCFDAATAARSSASAPINGWFECYGARGISRCRKRSRGRTARQFTEGQVSTCMRPIGPWCAYGEAAPISDLPPSPPELVVRHQKEHSAHSGDGERPIEQPATSVARRGSFLRHSGGADTREEYCLKSVARRRGVEVAISPHAGDARISIRARVLLRFGKFGAGEFQLAF
jgi:hypothetical protein